MASCAEVQLNQFKVLYYCRLIKQWKARMVVQRQIGPYICLCLEKGNARNVGYFGKPNSHVTRLGQLITVSTLLQTQGFLNLVMSDVDTSIC